MNTKKFLLYYVGVLLITVLIVTFGLYRFVTYDSPNDISNELNIEKETIYSNFHNQIKEDLKNSKYIRRQSGNNVAFFDKNFNSIKNITVSSDIFREYDVNDIKKDKNNNIWVLFDTFRTKENFQNIYPNRDIMLINTNNTDKYKLISFETLYDFGEVCFDKNYAYIVGSKLGKPYIRLGKVNLDNYNVDIEREYEEVQGNKPHQVSKIFCNVDDDNIIVFTEKGIYNINKQTFEAKELFANQEGFLYSSVYNKHNNKIYFNLNKFEQGNRNYLSVYDINSGEFKFELLNVSNSGILFDEDKNIIYTKTTPLGKPELDIDKIGPNGEIPVQFEKEMDNYEKKIKLYVINLSDMSIEVKDKDFIENMTIINRNYIIDKNISSDDTWWKIFIEI